MMIKPKHFCERLAKSGLEYFSGVPDSLLKDLCAYIDDNLPAQNHVISANEGNAIAIAAGQFLGSGKPSVVYMQNSGLGNTINPLTSLADPAVYSIPMLLLIGWRGEPGVKDEPQHLKQGELTESQLNVLGIPYIILDGDRNIEEELDNLLSLMGRDSRPVAILIRKNTFTEYKQENTTTLSHHSDMKREDALAVLLDDCEPDDLIVSTTGKTSREVFELRQKRQQENRDFLTVGAMGHTASIAMGVAMTRPERKVIALDGDGSLLMHMGCLPVIAGQQLSNLVHVILNNQCHESVGGQDTSIKNVDLRSLALACGYNQFETVSDLVSLKRVWNEIKLLSGPLMLEVKLKSGSRNDLGRPTNTPIENKQMFMNKALNGVF